MNIYIYIYSLTCLIESTDCELAEKNGEVLGILIGKLEYEYKNIRKRRNIVSINNSIKIILICTDSESNYGFYERYRFTKINREYCVFKGF